MAKIGEMTISVFQSRTGQQIKLSTTGRRGQVLLNTVQAQQSYPGQSPSDTAPDFWHDVLVKAGLTF